MLYLIFMNWALGMQEISARMPGSKQRQDYQPEC